MIWQLGARKITMLPGSLKSFASLMAVALAFGWLLVAGVPAHAASFNCAKAKTPIERFTCSDPELSELDSGMARSFSKKRSSLDGIAARTFVQEQRDWLTKIRLTLCGIIDYNNDSQQLECMINLYKERIARIIYAPITLLYSAEGKLCGPLHRAAEAYRRENPTQSLFGWVFPEIAPAAGITDVAWIGNIESPIGRNFGGATWFQFRADLVGDNNSRVIVVNDRIFGRVPSIETDVYVLKPGAALKILSKVTQAGRDKLISTEIDPDVVDLWIGFDSAPRNIVGYPSVRYRDRQRIKFPETPAPDLTADEYVFGSVPHVFSGPQTAFLFDGRPFFLLGELRSAMTYRIRSDMAIEPVCIWVAND